MICHKYRFAESAEYWWSGQVSFADVEAVGVALKGTHVELVDYRVMPKLVREKAALDAERKAAL